jgi:hypothetical protein
MEEQSEAVFANRDEALPVFAASTSSPKQSTREKLKSKISGHHERSSDSGGSVSIQERLFTK